MAAGEKVNIPKCDKDNTFKAKQCSKEECWCVKKDCEIIPGTKKSATEPLDCIAERGRYCEEVNSAVTCDGYAVWSLYCDSCHFDLYSIPVRVFFKGDNLSRP